MNSFLLFKSLLLGILSVVKILVPLLLPLIILVIIVIISIIYHYIFFRYVKHMVPKKGNPRPKGRGLLMTLIVDFPRQLTYDYIHQDPDDFGEFGIHMVIGEQGSGKTMTVVYLLEKWKRMYPKMKVYTNMAYKYEDGELVSWKDLLENNNDKRGIVNVIDEIKTWWSNRDSKDVPPEILGEICQQRKQKKATIGTVQVFSELAKPFRSQSHFVYVPYTFLGCLTIVFKTKGKWYDIEKDRFRKYNGIFVFAHNKRLRNAYDTFKKIEKYKDVTFGTSPHFKDGEAPQVVEVSVRGD